MSQPSLLSLQLGFLFAIASFFFSFFFSYLWGYRTSRSRFNDKSGVNAQVEEATPPPSMFPTHVHTGYAVLIFLSLVVGQVSLFTKYAVPYTAMRHGMIERFSLNLLATFL